MTSAERVLVQASSPPSAYSAREQREGELSVALGRHLAQHPHSINQSVLAPNRSNVPESGTAPNSDNVYPGLPHVEALSRVGEVRHYLLNLALQRIASSLSILHFKWVIAFSRSRGRREVR